MKNRLMSSPFLYHAEGADFKTPLDHLIKSEEGGEQAETLDLGDLKEIPRDAIVRILTVFLPNTNPTQPQYWRTAAAKLCVVAHALHIEPIGSKPLSALAEALGCTRALLSHRAVHLRDFAGLDCNAGRSSRARQVYSDTAKAVWRKRQLNNGA